MMEPSIHEIVIVLIEDPILILRWLEVCHALLKDQIDVYQWEKQFRTGLITAYILISNIGRQWIYENGSSATVEEFIKILESLHFLSVCENLRDEFGLKPADPLGPFKIHLKKKKKPANKSNKEIKTVVIKPDPPRSIDQVERRSEVDRNFIITDEVWVLSLVRNAYRTKHYEHTFIVIEGRNGNKSLITFMDFTADVPESDLEQTHQKENLNGLLRIFEKQGELETKLLCTCNLPMMKIWNHEIASHTIRLSRMLSEEIINSVKADIEEKHFPWYQMAGSSSVVSHSQAGSRSKKVGHNCFSWAKDIVIEYGGEGISKSLPNDWFGIICVVPSRHLVSEDWSRSDFYPYGFICPAILIVLFAIYVYKTLLF